MVYANVSGAGGGFISSATGPLFILAVILTAVAIPVCREGLTTAVAAARDHFFGPPSARDATNETGETADASSQESSSQPDNPGRASDFDEYDFDLDVLSEGDTC